LAAKFADDGWKVADLVGSWSSWRRRIFGPVYWTDLSSLALHPLTEN